MCRYLYIIYIYIYILNKIYKHTISTNLTYRTSYKLRLKSNTNNNNNTGKLGVEYKCSNRIIIILSSHTQLTIILISGTSCLPTKSLKK